MIVRYQVPNIKANGELLWDLPSRQIARALAELENWIYYKDRRVRLYYSNKKSTIDIIAPFCELYEINLFC